MDVAADRRFDEETRDRLSAIQHGYERWTRLTYSALIIFAVTFVATVAVGSYLIAQNGKASKALCAFRADLDRRTDAAKEFLAAHPNGIPGIPAVTLRTSIENQKRTIRALRSLKC